MNRSKIISIPLTPILVSMSVKHWNTHPRSQSHDQLLPPSHRRCRNVLRGERGKSPVLGLATLLSELLRRSSEMLRTNGRLLHKVRGRLSTLVLRSVKFSEGKRIPFRTKSNIIINLFLFISFKLFKCYFCVLQDQNNMYLLWLMMYLLCWIYMRLIYCIVYTSKTIMTLINVFSCFLHLISESQLW